ncbi:hypothetical protein [Pantoea cypripedii]|jgi:hypothetical protein|uniref:Bacteriocin n=1 Tax=Pantoea cypripedii TaxID=55209 RepID=A0A1X1ETD6_PANCY|nr:hypothetical protein [Pantoea cypripedii]MBP2197369.1 hypothetical protein [Pantoea cypripedii]ORM93276.1 hypothetical protein HA50_07925 [Pantoea cypripedii]
MKTLNIQEMDMVSGAGNFADKSTGGRVDNDSRGGRGGGAPSSCANQVGMGAILGTIGAIAMGPVGMGAVAAGAGMGALTGGLGCNNSPYGGNGNNGGNSSGNSSSNNIGGQCHW